MDSKKRAVEAAQRVLNMDLFRLQTLYRMPWDKFFEWVCYRIFVANVPECEDTQTVRAMTKELKGLP